MSVSKLDMPGPYLGGVHLKVCTAAPRTLGILSMAILFGALSWCALAGEIMADRMVVKYIISILVATHHIASVGAEGECH